MKHLWAVGLLALAGAAVWAEQPLPTPETFRIPPGYLEQTALPDSAALIPAPPVSGSAAQARDDAASRNGQALHGSARWDLATADAELFSPHDTEALSCAAGFAIGPDSAPATNRLLTRAMIDLALSTSGAKKKYQRARPFMENGAPNCTPAHEAYLRKDGSYPSGHSAIGYGWGLIMAELVPARATELVARGRAFGDSRRVCNVHWLSDIEEGRVVASATVAKLHAAASFQKDLQAARDEIAAGKLVAPKRDCAKEAAALAL